MSIQEFSTQVTKPTSLWVSTSFIQLTALIVYLLAWAFQGQAGLTLMEVPNKWTLLGERHQAAITVTVVKYGRSRAGQAAMLIVITSSRSLAHRAFSAGSAWNKHLLNGKLIGDGAC